ncbi:MAG: MotA/TolQ/ExbB proton channel family protein [candidate division WOR-3 bacterium]
MGFLSPFLHAGPFAQAIILILFVMSVVSWAIFLRKWRALRRATVETRTLLSQLSGRARLADYERVALAHQQSPLASLLIAALREWDSLSEQFRPAEGGPELLQQLIPNITEATERAASRETDRLESSLSFLAITTMVAPFLGLLGTVQGVLATFLSLRGAQLPTLQLIAPGISDALVTTVMGLLVAIPAALFYNYFAGRVRALQSEMERFASELTGIFRREIVSSALAQSPKSKL